MCRSQDNFQTPVLSINHVGSKDQTEVVRMEQSFIFSNELPHQPLFILWLKDFILYYDCFQILLQHTDCILFSCFNLLFLKKKKKTIELGGDGARL